MNALNPLASSYWLYDTLNHALAPAAGCFGAASAMFSPELLFPWSHASGISAFAGQIHRSLKTYPDPGFDIDGVTTSHLGTQSVTEIDLSGGDAWMRLTHFKKPDSAEQPAVLVIAPYSGHNPSLIRDTVRGLLRDHDVAVLGFANAAEVSPDAGTLGIDAMVERIIHAATVFSADPDHAGTRRPLHVLAVCQPAPLALVAASLLEARGTPLASLALMGGPIDPAANHTDVTRFADSRPIDWYERNLIAEVAPGHAGSGRRVYPGFCQLASFIAMNPERHFKSWQQRFFDAMACRFPDVERHDRFYDDYLAVLDLPAEFYLETVERVFQRRLVAKNEWAHQGEVVDIGTLSRTALATFEGAEDDICAPGQTSAAHDLTPLIPEARRLRYIQPGAGHYGLFSGRKWREEILPAYAAFIDRSNRHAL